MTWGDIFDEAASQAEVQYEIVRPSLDWMKEHGVESLPSQIPEESGKPGIYRMDVQKAIDAGLIFTPLADTIHNTLEWRKTVSDPLKAGLTDEKEKELLREYLKSEF